MLWIALGILGLLVSFVMIWKREGITQAILNLISLVSFMAILTPINNSIRLSAIIIGIFCVVIAFILDRKPKNQDK